MPWALYVSRVAEEFGCPPTMAEREIRRDPELVSDVLEARAMTRAVQEYRVWQDAKGADRGELSRMAALVKEFDFKG